MTTAMTGVLVAVDVGRVRVGLARCDEARVLALPEATVPRDASTVHRVAETAREYAAVAIIVGLPLTLRGERGGSAEDAMVFAEELAAVAPCEVRMLDERLTTRQAQRGLSAAGRTHRRSRAVIDQAAAVILLNHALDTERATGTPAGRRVTVGESPAGPGAATDPTDEGRSSP